MSQQKLKITELRQIIAEKEGRVLRGFLPSSTLASGIPKGAISEIAGTARIEWVAQFLSENPRLNVFWAEKVFSLFPTAFYQRGISLNRFIFAECGDELFASVRKALRSQVFQCVVSPLKFPDEKFLKALQLLTERSNCSLLLLSERIEPRWPICLQVRVNQTAGESAFEIDIYKNKRGIAQDALVTM